MKPVVYILQDTISDKYYVGSTTNLDRRLKQHNAGHTQTTRNSSWKLVFHQGTQSILKAREAEKRIKSWKRRDYIDRIVREGKISFLDA